MARTLPNDVITNIVGIAVSTINPEDYQIWTDSGSALNPPRNLLYREIVSAGTYYTVRHVQVVCNPSDTIRVTFKITNNEACATIHIHSLKDISGVNWFEPR